MPSIVHSLQAISKFSGALTWALCPISGSIVELIVYLGGLPVRLRGVGKEASRRMDELAIS